MFIRTPHTVLVERPSVTQDAGNVSTKDYSNPASSSNVKCMFQTRAGTSTELEAGKYYTYDGVLFVRKSSVDIQVDDRVTVSLEGTNAKFLVVAPPEAKYSVKGKFNHYEIALTLETNRT